LFVKKTNHPIYQDAKVTEKENKMTQDITKDMPEEIWLEHPSACDPQQGQMWCADRDALCDEGDFPPVKYIRADDNRSEWLRQVENAFGVTKKYNRDDNYLIQQVSLAMRMSGKTCDEDSWSEVMASEAIACLRKLGALE
jgi:hypothetical protein